MQLLNRFIRRIVEANSAAQRSAVLTVVTACEKKFEIKFNVTNPFNNGYVAKYGTDDTTYIVLVSRYDKHKRFIDINTIRVSGTMRESGEQNIDKLMTLTMFQRLLRLSNSMSELLILIKRFCPDAPIEF